MTAASTAAPRTGEQGFTLIEIMAVLLLSGIVLYAIYAVLFSMYTAQDEIESTLEGFRSGPRIVEHVIEDLRHVVYGAVAEGKALRGRSEHAGGREVSILDIVTSRDSAAVERRRGGEPRPPSDVTEVGYRVRDTGTGSLALYRREQWGVDDDPLAGGKYYRIYSRVKEFQLRYIERGEEEKPVDEYPLEWDSAVKKGLPRAVWVRIVLEIGDAEKLEARREEDEEAGLFAFERIVQLPQFDDQPIPEAPQDPGTPTPGG